MNFEENISSLIVTEAAITIGKRLGVRIVTEGVEDDSQEEMLRAMGCDVMQGYLFGRPMPPTDLKAWISEHPMKQTCSDPEKLLSVKSISIN